MERIKEGGSIWEVQGDTSIDLIFARKRARKLAKELARDVRLKIKYLNWPEF